MLAILFDLDGTLLDIHLETFLRDYFDALRQATSEAYPGLEVMESILASTEAMQQPHPGITNRQAFNSDFLARTGIDLGDDANWGLFEDFYRDVFPGLGANAKGKQGARRAVETALELGLPVAIATQPIFPLSAVRHRLAWAELDDLTPDVITTYETMHACKPLREYFTETAQMLGTEPGDCIMVGDDRGLDLPAADTGMRTFYTGESPVPLSDWQGNLDEFSDLLLRLVDERA